MAQGRSPEKLLSIEVQKEFDVLEKTWQERVFVKLYVAARSSGLLATISDRNWKTLCAIATFMDKNGNCYPSQAQIAKALGISRATANERIASLTNFRFKGQPIVLKTHLRDQRGKFGCCRYTVLPLANLHIFGESRISTVSGKSDTVLSDSDNPDTNKNHIKQEPGLELEKRQPEEVVVQSSSQVVDQKEKQIDQELETGKLPEETRKRRKEELRATLRRYSQEVIDEALKRTVEAKKRGEVRKDIIRFFGGVCRNVEEEFKGAEVRRKHESEEGKKSRLRVAASLRDDLIKAGWSKEEIEKELLRHYDSQVVSQVMQKFKRESGLP